MVDLSLSMKLHGPGTASLTRLLQILILTALSHAALPAHTAPQLSSLPPALAQWYKPENKRHVWLHTMFSLRREMQAVEEYAESGERALALAWGERFAKHLRSIPEMVPEWRDMIDWDELERLEHTLSEGKLSDVSHHADRVRRDCRNCHREYRVLAALRYRSPDFSEVTLDDGHGKTIDFSSHMQRLSLTLNRIKIASVDARWDAASTAADSFKAELKQLSETCASCHQDAAPQARILGESSDAIVNDLSLAIEQRQPRQTGRFLGQAAVDICARCHATHRTLSEMRQLLFD